MDAAGIALIVGALLGAGGLSALVRARSLNRATDATTAVTLGGGWQELWRTAHADLNELRDRLLLAEERITAAERNEAECRAKLERLSKSSTRAEDVERLVVALVDQELARRGEPR